ncbi:MAG: hypothetical protein NVSMB2_02520 [Chloroflexota bacterium]
MNTGAAQPVSLGIAQRSDFPFATDENRYAAWFRDLDAWTEYWDVYHPESRGRFYFGDGESEPGLLTRLLPHIQRPPLFNAWTCMALEDRRDMFEHEAQVAEIAAAVREVDGLVDALFNTYFGDPSHRACQVDYLEAMFRFAIDILPPATQRAARIADDDWRKRTAGRHTLDGDLMWFAWALELEAAEIVAETGAGHARRTLQMAGVATGCAANFAWRGHRRTRSVYRADDTTALLLRTRGLQWASDFAAAAAEVHALFRIREWGDEMATSPVSAATTGPHESLGG